MESKGRVFRPHGALMVLPCMGSLTQVTIWPAPRTARMRCGSLTLMFSAPILAMMVILPGLFWGFSISISFTSSFGSILSLTCISNMKTQHSLIDPVIQLEKDYMMLTGLVSKKKKDYSWILVESTIWLTQKSKSKKQIRHPLYFPKIIWSWSRQQINKLGYINSVKYHKKNKATLYLDAQGVGNTTEELYMGAIKLAGALTNPKEVSRAVIEESRGGVLTGKRLLIGEEKALVWGPEFGCRHYWVINCKASGSHEAESLVNPMSELTVSVLHMHMSINHDINMQELCDALLEKHVQFHPSNRGM